MGRPPPQTLGDRPPQFTLSLRPCMNGVGLLVVPTFKHFCIPISAFHECLTHPWTCTSEVASDHETQTFSLRPRSAKTASSPLPHKWTFIYPLKMPRTSKDSKRNGLIRCSGVGRREGE